MTVADGINIAVDMGGTNCRLAAYRSTKDTEPLGTTVFPMTQKTATSYGDFDKDYTRLLLAAGRLTARYGALQALGLSIAGKFSSDRRRLVGAGNLGHWVDEYFVDELTEDLGCEVFADNDAKAGGLAEALYGHGQGRDFLFDILGTGFGGCFVNANVDPIDNERLRIFAGEPGHMMVNPADGPECFCGQIGCLEAYVGGAGIKRRFGKDPKDGTLTDEEWDDILGWLIIGLRTQLCDHADADLVVFSGGIMCNRPELLQNLQARLSETLKVREAPALIISKFGEGAGTLGALALIDYYSEG